MNASISNGLRALAIVIIVIAAAAAGLTVGQLMQGIGDATTVGDLGVRHSTDRGANTAPVLTTIRYWDLAAPADEPSHPHPGQRKARSTPTVADPDAAVKRGLTPR